MKNKIMAAIMAACMIVSPFTSCIQTYANGNVDIPIPAGITGESIGKATPSDATVEAGSDDPVHFDAGLLGRSGNGFKEFDNWLDKYHRTDETVDYRITCQPYFFNPDGYVDLDTGMLQFNIDFYDIGTQKRVVHDELKQDEESAFVNTYGLKANNIYYFNISQDYDNVEFDGYTCGFDDSVYEGYILPITKDAYEGSIGDNHPVSYNVVELPDTILMIYELDYWGDEEEWYDADYDWNHDEWTVDPYTFDNCLYQAAKFRFTGNKEYTVNDIPVDPSKFTFSVSRLKDNSQSPVDSSAETYMSQDGSYELEYTENFNCDEDGVLETGIQQMEENSWGAFIVGETTAQPNDTASHQYIYDDTEYGYIVFYYSERPEPQSEDYFEPEYGIYYATWNGFEFSEPVLAGQDEDGVYIIPGNDFINKEYVEGASVSLTGNNDYKVDREKSDASGFKYSLTGWPGTNGHLEVGCQEDGTLIFPEPIFLGYDNEVRNTITVHQVTKQPDDTEDRSYSYDPGVYQFEMKFIEKSEAESYSIPEESLDAVDGGYVLIYNDYRTSEWKAADTAGEGFTISGIDFMNRSDKKESRKFIVQFDTDDGGCVKAYVDVNNGSLIRQPAAPTKDGYTFDGWYKEKDLVNAWDFSKDAVTSDLVLYAKWTKAENPGSGSGSGGGSSVHGGNSGSGSSGQSVSANDPGWFKNNGIWYYKDYKSNSLKKGWHLDPYDNYWYYLDLNDGHMYIGWNLIDGKWYYFNPEELAPNQTWFIDSSGRWYYDNTHKTKPFGSMYVDEKTPDGHSVNGKGECVQ